MRIEADYNACEGHGLCEDAAPKIFTVDDDGILTHHFEGQDIPAELQESARDSVAICPVIALRLVP
ncbi:ferredoxin [Actinocorallia longicatena]